MTKGITVQPCIYASRKKLVRILREAGFKAGSPLKREGCISSIEYIYSMRAGATRASGPRRKHPLHLLSVKHASHAHSPCGVRRIRSVGIANCPLRVSRVTFWTWRARGPEPSRAEPFARWSLAAAAGRSRARAPPCSRWGLPPQATQSPSPCSSPVSEPQFPEPDQRVKP